MVKAESSSELVTSVMYDDGVEINALFTHQDHVVDSGEMNVIASSEHCGIVACQHPTRDIKTVQYHPEATAELMLKAIECGDISEQESQVFDMSKQLISVSQALL